MQTFLPYADISKSLACLDPSRLGKQRSECKQIITALLRDSKDPHNQGVNTESLDLSPRYNDKGKLKKIGWLHHSATRAWRGHVGALAIYHDFSIMHWIARGYVNNMAYLSTEGRHPMPDWWGDERYHSSHRANLLRKDPAHYGQFGWTEDPATPYFWPV